jgi:ferredoxin/DNA-binding IscR family transcriptional regulator/DNA-binding MarR family transcriptional regulator
MAPKRRRMMDMVLYLGGLKEETAIPLSKVNEELNNLKTELEPLTQDILSFPDAYLSEFLAVFKRAGLVESINDKGILTAAISNLESATSSTGSDSLAELSELLKGLLEKIEGTDKKETTAEKVIDVGAVLKPLPEILSQIETMVGEYEKKIDDEAEKAKTELETILIEFADIVDEIDSDPQNALDKLQKLGTKTRYGTFIRAAAQVKRGHREKRIDDDRFLELLSTNLLIEFRRGLIIFILNRMGSKTVVQLGDLMKTSPRNVQHAIVSMIQRGEVEMAGLDGDAPVFARVLSQVPDTTLILKRIIQQLRGVVKAVEGDVQELTTSPLKRLETILEKLQLLGEYDEAAVSEPVNKLREMADTATESILSTHVSDDVEELRLLVSAGLEAFTRFRLKITLEKGPNLVSGVNVYGEKLDPEVYKKMMANYLDNELERGTMLILIRRLGAMTAEDLANKTNIPQQRVFQHLLRLKRDELLILAGEKHGYVLFDVPRIPTEAEVILRTVSSLALQLAEAKAELERILGELKPEDIGKLVGALETFSKARDKLSTVTIGDSVIAKATLDSVEDKIKSAVLLAYRTRTRLPSTRPKVTIEDLMDVDVPSVLDEYRSQMGYAPLLGFGTIHWEQSKCLGCKSCEIACPEDAVKLKPVIEIPGFFEFTEESMDKLPANKALFYRTLRSLAKVKPSHDIKLEEEKPGFGTVEVDLWLCVACRTCVRRCPGPENGALELELHWNLPEVVKQITGQT